jgi:hypothetical protein
VNQDTVGARSAPHDVLMRKLTRFAAAAALVAFGVGASATAANAMMSTPPDRICGERSVAEAVEMLPATVGGPYVLNLQAICLAP